MVGSGAIYTMLPEGLLDRLGVDRLETDIFKLADDRLVEYAIGSAVVRIKIEGFACSHGPSRPDSTQLLGATTLEIIRTVADPVNEQLTPSRRMRARFF